MMKKYIILNIIACLAFFNSNWQNLLDNHSFEKAELTIYKQPNQFGDFRHVKNWGGAEYCNIFSTPATCLSTGYSPCSNANLLSSTSRLTEAGPHAPDWFRTNDFLLEEDNNTGTFKQIIAPHGRGYAGIKRGTLIQQKMNGRIKYKKSYKLKLKIRLPTGQVRGIDMNDNGSCLVYESLTSNGNPTFDWKTSKLNVYLASGDLNYKYSRETSCIASSSDYKNWVKVEGAKHFYKAATIDINLDKFPAGEWHEIEIFLKPDALLSPFGFNPMDIDQPYDWIAFDLDHDVKSVPSPTGGIPLCNNPVLLLGCSSEIASKAPHYYDYSLNLGIAYQLIKF